MDVTTTESLDNIIDDLLFGPGYDARVLAERQCRDHVYWLWHGTLIILAVFSLVIFTILAFIQRRKRLRNCLWGYPGIPIPLDLFVYPRSRFVYVILFGLMVTTLQAASPLVALPPITNFYLQIVYRTVFTPLIVTIITCVVLFPLFGCVDAPIPLLGQILGLIYSIVWCGFSLGTELHADESLRNHVCTDSKLAHATVRSVFLHVARYLPVIGCSIIVLIWYVFKVVQGFLSLCDIPKGRNLGKQAFVCCGKPVQLRATDVPRYEVKFYHVRRVKSLLSKPEEPKKRGKVATFLIKVVQYFFPYRKDFRLPLIFLGAVFAMPMLLYQLTLKMVMWGITFAEFLPPLFDLSAPLLRQLENHVIQTNMSSNNTIQRLFNGLIDLSSVLGRGIPAFTILSPLVSFIFCMCLLMHMMGSVSKQLKKVAREGFNVKLPSPVKRVTSTVKIAGYILGYSTLAWMIYTGVVYLCLLAVSVIYIAFKNWHEQTFRILMYILIPVIWTQLVLHSQSLIVRFVFFADQKGMRKFISITNTRLFLWLAYFLFLFNGIAAFVMAIVRTIISILFSLLLLFRLDHVVMIRGFEMFDFPHNAYLGFLYIESTYSNAVLHVFLSTLVHSIRSKHSHLDQDKPEMKANNKLELSELGELRPRSLKDSRRVRNRWLVAYTLVRNPSLQKFTASNLRAAKEGDGVPDKHTEADLELVEYNTPPATIRSRNTAQN